MTNLLLLNAGSFISLTPASTSNAIAIDGTPVSNFVNGSVTTLPIPSTSSSPFTTANSNDVIVAIFSANSVNGAIAVSDTTGLTWNSVVTSTGTNKIYMYYARSSIPYSGYVQVTVGTSWSFAAGQVIAFSGMSTAATVVDVSNSVVTSTVSVVTTNPNDGLVGGARVGLSSGSAGPGAPWTTFPGGTGTFQNISYQIVTSTNTYTLTEPSTSNGMVLAAFKSA